MKERRGINRKAQFNFVWMFALIAGGAILFLAIYGALKVGEGEGYEEHTAIAKSLSFLIDPLQAGFSEGNFGTINFKEETRINNFCFEDDLGSNKISVSTRSKIGNEWKIPGVETRIHNKYIFSSEKDSGKIYYVFSKPFDFPYKVSDLIFITSKEYCFINAPDDVLGDVSIVQNINTSEGCVNEGFVNVCFGSGGDECDMVVYVNPDSNSGTVSKAGAELTYFGGLLYAAIYSDKTIYECNVKRLLYRTGKIAENLALKADLMSAKNCNTNLRGDVLIWRDKTINATMDKLLSLYLDSGPLEMKNKGEVCGLWS
jgi:hypothetical protein